MLPCAFKPPSGCFGKFPLEYFFVHIYSVFAYFCLHVHVLSSDHRRPAHSNTVMLLMLPLHFLSIIGLFQLQTLPVCFTILLFWLTLSVNTWWAVPSGQWETAFLIACYWLFILWRCFWDASGPAGWDRLHCLRADLNKSKMYYLPFTASNPPKPFAGWYLMGMCIRCLLSAPPYLETVAPTAQPHGISPAPWLLLAEPQLGWGHNTERLKKHVSQLSPPSSLAQLKSC